MAAYQRGDHAALVSLLELHEKPLWNFLRRLVRDEAAAEDLLQETFMRVVKNAAHWKPNAKFSTWLYTIARHLAVDYLRRASHRKTLSLDAKSHDARDSDPDGRLHEALAGAEPGGERKALDRELATRIETALAALPDNQREVFLMREVAGLSFAEIASAVGAGEPTVKSRMRYALEALRSALAPWHEATAPEVTP